MKKHRHRNKFTQILCALFLVIVCSTAVVGTTLSEVVDGVYRRAVSTYDNKDYKGALKQFKKMQKEYPMSKHAVRGWEYIAQCENVLGDKYASFEAYQKIWDNHKSFKKLSTITKNQMTIADDFFKLKRYKLSIEIYSKILQNAPYSGYAAAAQYSIANALVKREDYFAAKEEFRKLIKNYPMSQYVDDAAFNLGYVDYLQSVGKDYDQTETTQSIIAFRQFIHEFPSSPKVYEAQKYIQKLRNRKAASLFRTGEYYENIRAPKAACISFKQVIEQYPDTDYADQARKRINKINDSKIAKSVQAQQVVKMVRLENQKELAQNKDIANQEKLKQKSVESEESIEMPKDETESVNNKEEQINKEYAKRIKELYMDSEMREELRSTIKDRVSKEKFRDKERKKAWKQQKLVEEVAPAEMEVAEQVASIINTDEQENDEDVAAESAEYHRELLEEIAAASADTEIEESVVVIPEPTKSLPENFKIDEGKVDHSYNNEQSYSSVDSGDEESSIDYEAVTETPAEDVKPEAVTETPAEDVKPEAVTETPAEDVKPEAVAETPVEDVKPEAVAETPVEDVKPEAVADKPAEKTKNADSLVEEQKRAERLERMVKYIKKRDGKEKIKTRKLSGVGNVRRASVKDSGKKSEAEVLQSQYVTIYYLIQSGDAAMQRRILSDAKRFYGKALDGLLDIKSKAPEWKSDIVNWRISDCREKLNKIK